MHEWDDRDCTTRGTLGAGGLPWRQAKCSHSAVSQVSERERGFAVVDVETTGLFPGRGDRVVEVAVVLVDSTGQPIAEWTTVVNPGGPVGPTQIHRLSDRDVRDAPTFGEMLGELNELLAGRALVAHNAPFDLAFLELEYARAGWQLPDVPYLCTLEASGAYLPAIPRRRLAQCCRAIGVELGIAHTALADARGAGALLGHYMRAESGWRTEHAALPQRAAGIEWPEIPRCLGITARPRVAACDLEPGAPPGTLARLLNELPLTVDDRKALAPQASGYLELVARVLEDGVLTDAEAHELAGFAKRYSMTPTELGAAHRDFLLGLARRAVADGKVTKEERRALLEAAEALGLGTDLVKHVLADARAAVADNQASATHQLPQSWEHGEPLRIGDAVVFTGCEEVQRARLEGRAQAAGLRVIASVSGKTAVLVTDGADPTTNKARRAQELGTRTITPDVFAILVEYVQSGRS